MRVFNFSLLAFIVLISGCTTFNSIKPIESQVGFNKPTAKSLQPVLRWQKLEGYDGNYDLIVMVRKNYRFQMPFMEVVYARESITSTEHKVEVILVDDTQYYWSVRPSNNKSDDAWARYSFYLITGVYNFWYTDSFFHIKTPEVKPLAIN